MIKFFRRIRQKLLSENKFSKYLIYAIGEIILVIIGILIALQINNQNEKRKSENEVYSTLLQVHTELAENIKGIDDMFLEFMRYDTIVNNIMNNRLNPNDYKKRESYHDPLNYWATFDIKDYSFQKLILNTNDISSQYDELITDLQKLYTDRKQNVQFSSNTNEKFVQDYREWKKLNTTWYQYEYGKIKPELTNEELDFYFSNESPYRNFVMHYRVNDEILLEMLNNFRFHAYQIYKDLTKLLKLKANKVESFSKTKEMTPQEINSIIGKYQFDSFEIEISTKDNKLFWQKRKKDITEEKKELFFITKSYFFINEKYWAYHKTLNYDINKNVVGMTIKKEDISAEGKK